MKPLKAVAIAIVTTVTLSACHPVLASDKFLDLDRSKYLPETQQTFNAIEKDATNICKAFAKNKPMPSNQTMNDCINTVAEDYVDSLMLGMDYQEVFGVRPDVKKAYGFFIKENGCGVDKICADHSLNQAVYFGIGYSVSELSSL